MRCTCVLILTIRGHNIHNSATLRYNCCGFFNSICRLWTMCTTKKWHNISCERLYIFIIMYFIYNWKYEWRRDWTIRCRYTLHVDMFHSGSTFADIYYIFAINRMSNQPNSRVRESNKVCRLVWTKRFVLRNSKWFATGNLKTFQTRFVGTYTHTHTHCK